MSFNCTQKLFPWKDRHLCKKLLPIVPMVFVIISEVHWHPSSSTNVASNSDSIFYFHWHIVKSNLHGVTEHHFVSSEAYVWFAHVKNNSRKYIVTSASPRSYITQFPTIIYGRFSFQIEYKRNLLKKTVKWIENSR